MQAHHILAKHILPMIVLVNTNNCNNRKI